MTPISKQGNIMDRFSATIMAVIAAGAIGCTQATTLKEAPVSVSGKVSQAGKPVGEVLVSFHPLDKGHVVSLPVNADGTFTGEMISGNYSYYVGKSPAHSSATALAKVDPKYYEPAMDRSISVESGKELVLALD
jgi:hypothetical protein